LNGYKKGFLGVRDKDLKYALIYTLSQENYKQLIFINNIFYLYVGISPHQGTQKGADACFL
jgi:hypothetical protein